MECPNCHTKIAIHADGTLACSCQFVEMDDPMPVEWVDIQDVMETRRNEYLAQNEMIERDQNRNA